MGVSVCCGLEPEAKSLSTTPKLEVLDQCWEHIGRVTISSLLVGWQMAAIATVVTHHLIWSQMFNRR